MFEKYIIESDEMNAIVSELNNAICIQSEILSHIESEGLDVEQMTEKLRESRDRLKDLYLFLTKKEVL